MKVQREINPFIAKIERKEVHKDHGRRRWRVALAVIGLLMFGGVVVMRTPDSEKPTQRQTDNNPILLLLPDSADKVAVHVNGFQSDPHRHEDPGLALVILHPAPIIIKRGHGVTALAVFLDDVPPSFTSSDAVHTNLVSIIKVLPASVKLLRLCIHDAVSPPDPKLISWLLNTSLSSIVISNGVHHSWNTAMRFHNLSMVSQDSELTSWAVV